MVVRGPGGNRVPAVATPGVAAADATNVRASCPGARRAPRWPPPRRWSRSGCSDRGRASRRRGAGSRGSASAGSGRGARGSTRDRSPARRGRSWPRPRPRAHRRQPVERLFQILRQLLECPGQGLRTHGEEVRTRGNGGRVPGGELGDRGPEPATDPVAIHGRTEPAGDRERHPRGVGSGTGQIRGGKVGHTEDTGANPPAGTTQLEERASVADRPDQADSLCRPLSRRDRSTARPARVDIRCRKPCFLARRRLLGWYVRFTMFLLDHEASWPPADDASPSGSGAARSSASTSHDLRALPRGTGALRGVPAG